MAFADDYSNYTAYMLDRVCSARHPGSVLFPTTSVTLPIVGQELKSAIPQC